MNRLHPIVDRKSSTRPQAAASTRSVAEAMLRDIAYVCRLTQSVKESLSKPERRPALVG
jgi:hypothetical protein